LTKYASDTVYLV